MQRVVFILGAPGAGKTTVVRALLGARAQPIGRWTVGGSFCAAGPYTGELHDGPDRLPYSAALLRAVLGELATLSPSLVALLDGPRFGPWARAPLASAGARCIAVLLQASVADRVRRRAARGSKPMCPDWHQEHASKAEAFARSFPTHHIIDAGGGPADVAARVRIAVVR